MSVNLVKEKGVYKDFENLEWSKGIFFIDKVNNEVLKFIEKGFFNYVCDW